MIYYPPLSYWKDMIFLSEAFSTDAFNSMNFSNTSDFFLMKKTQVYLENSSMKMSTYWDQFIYVFGIGPLISE